MIDTGQEATGRSAMPRQAGRTTSHIVIIVPAYLAVWGASVGAYSIWLGGEPTLALISIVVLGGALPALALFLTRKDPPPRPIGLAPNDAWRALAYLAVFAVVVLGWGFSWVHDNLAGERSTELLLLLLKLITMAGIPLLLMKHAERARLWRGEVERPSLFATVAILGFLAFAISTVATGAVPALDALAPTPIELLWGAAGAWLWATVGAGLTEELLFRAYLQPRLTAKLRSEAGAIAAGAVVFALAHVPGLYLRTDQAELMANDAPSLVACVAYAIAVLSPPGILFGVIWARTRSLAALVIIHAMIDWPPNTAEFIALWR